jgi:hypothetical protein
MDGVSQASYFQFSDRVVRRLSPSYFSFNPTFASDYCQKIGQTVSRQNHPSISNPTRANNVSHRKHGSRCDHRTIHSRPSQSQSSLRYGKRFSPQSRNSLLPTTQSLCSPVRLAGSGETPGGFGAPWASFRTRVIFELEVITPSQNLCRSIGCPACVTRTQISLPPAIPWSSPC